MADTADLKSVSSEVVGSNPTRATEILSQPWGRAKLTIGYCEAHTITRRQVLAHDRAL